MQGWIVYKETGGNIVPDTYEIECFKAEAEKQNIDLKVISPEQFDIIVTREDRKSILIDGEPVALPDFVLPRMGAGTTYFALSILRHLERLGVPCINPSTSIETARDKLYSQQILAENNLPVPKTMLMKFPVNIELIEQQLGFPVVVKTISGTQGKGVFLAEKKGHLEDTMHLIQAVNPKYNLILQELIKNSVGKDLRALVVGGRVIACMQRKSQDDGFKANFSSGGVVEEYDLTPEIEWLATEAARILRLDIAGVDLLFDENHFKICEVNTAPGFKGLQSCCDVNVAAEIYHYLRIRYGKFS